MLKSLSSLDSTDSPLLTLAGVPCGTGGGSRRDKKVSKLSSAPKPAVVSSKKKFFQEHSYCFTQIHLNNLILK